MLHMTRAAVACGLLIAVLASNGFVLAQAQDEPEKKRLIPPQNSTQAPQPASVDANAGAQETAPPSETQPPVPAPKPEDPAQVIPVGDVIHLKSGKDLSGASVQVLRKASNGYLIEVFEGVAPITIPFSQIVSIDYDDFDPARDKRPKQAITGEDANIGIPGLRLSPELSRSLNAPLNEPVIKFEQTPLSEAIKELATRTKITINADPSLDSLPAESRTWTTEAKPETTLLTLLRDDLLVKLSDVTVDYKFDRIVVLTKQAAEAQRAKLNAPPPPEAPAPEAEGDAKQPKGPKFGPIGKNPPAPPAT
jgi:hypothetical protein